MPAPLPEADRLNIVNDYRSGKGSTTIARERGVNASTVCDIIRRAGITRLRSDAARFRFATSGHPRTVDLPTAVIATAYQSGRSATSLANEYGCTIRAINKRLDQAGVRRRNARQAMASVDTVAMREAIAESVHRNASKVGRLETDIAGALRDRGELPDQQHPIGPYNIDIMIGTVAVEVHLNSGRPFNMPRILERIEHLANRGLSTAHVHVSRRTLRLDVGRVADQLVTLRQLAETLPPGHSQHWVIRGTGDLDTRCRADCDPWAFVPVSSDAEHPS